MNAADDLFGEPSACVYIVQSHYLRKVGVAKNLRKRIKQLQTGAPYPVVPLWAFRTTRVNAYKIERLVHVALGKLPRTTQQPHLVCGEWFKEGSEQIIHIIKKIAKSLGMAGIVEMELAKPIDYAELLTGLGKSDISETHTR